MALTFDANYYLTHRADVFQAFVATAGSTGLSWAQFAEQHYNNHGRFEGSNPNAIFKTNEYLAANPDVAAAGVNPFEHYLTHGVYEGRAPNASFPKLGAEFDADAYLAANSDLAEAGIDTPEEAYAHFVLHGQFENRPGAPAVDTGIPGETFTLTEAGGALAGTDRNDSFYATDTAAASKLAGAVIDGKGGVDSLYYMSSNAAEQAPSLVQNVEKIFIQSLAAGAGLNAANVKGAEEIWSNASTAAVAVSNIQNNVTLGVKDTTAALNATFAANKVGSNTATLNIAASGSTSTITVDVAGTDVFTKAAISSTGGKNNITLDAAQDADVELTELTVSGDAALTLASAAGANVEFTGLKVLDASGLKAGGLTIDLTGNATDTTKLAFKGSAGDDTITFATANLTGSMSLDGGAGKDTLVVTSPAGGGSVISAAAAAKISNFEVLRVGGDTLTAAQTIDGAAIAGLSEIQLSARAGAFDTKVTNLDSGDTVSILGNQAGNTVITYKATEVASGDDLKLTVNLGDAEAKSGASVALLNVNQTADLTINSVGGANTITAIDNGALKTLTVTGNKAVTVGTLDASALTSIDAAGLTLAAATENGVSVNAFNSTKAVTFVGSNGVDTYTASAKGDTITAGGGADTITLGTGSDKIVFTAASDSATGAADTVNGFDIAQDVIDISALTTGTFAYLGNAAFTASGNTQARYADANTLQIDVNGDGTADMTVTLTGVADAVTAGNFLV